MTLQPIDEYIEQQGIDTRAEGWRTRLPRPPEVTFEPDTRLSWRLDTSLGPVTVRLLPEVAPRHVASTVYLTRLGFYDGLVFHRVIPGFMAQGGCPLGTGTGGPGYEYEGECSPRAKHDRPGRLSMANAGPGTDGSQFFLTFAETPWLDGKHTVFGEVTRGMETLRAIEKRGSPSGRPSERLRIRQATILEE